MPKLPHRYHDDHGYLLLTSLLIGILRVYRACGLRYWVAGLERYRRSLPFVSKGASQPVPRVFSETAPVLWLEPAVFSGSVSLSLPLILVLVVVLVLFSVAHIINRFISRTVQRCTLLQRAPDGRPGIRSVAYSPKCNYLPTCAHFSGPIEKEPLFTKDEEYWGSPG